VDHDAAKVNRAATRRRRKLLPAGPALPNASVRENDMTETTITAALLVIGDEILSGRTKDKNIGYIAEYCTNIGIDLKEVRVVPDEMDEIVDALNALRRRYTYVFTTGGIGPTHDDITADAVAAALGVELYEDERIIKLMLERLKPEDLNVSRRRMARIPRGAEHVANPISKVPGFRIENVIVMAGVPSIMQAMLDDVAPKLTTGARMLSETIEATGIPEGAYAAGLGAIAKDHPEVIIGSYPQFVDGRFRNQIVVRSKDAASLDIALAKVDTMLKEIAAGRDKA
jgi:molybdenum cofactor synthesis domain-containing protein